MSTDTDQARERDRRIAEMLGVASYDVVIDGCSRAGPFSTREEAEAAKPDLAKRFKVGGVTLSGSVPRYSDDPAATLELVEMMTAPEPAGLGYKLELRGPLVGGEWGARFYREGRAWEATERRGSTWVEAVAAAALAAVGKGEE